jgi:class 3 adenylate cyclase
MPEISRRLTTILAADVAGYSRLAGADEEGTVSRLRALRQELIDPVIAANGGRLVKTTGDGRLIEFDSVVDALQASPAPACPSWIFLRCPASLTLEDRQQDLRAHRWQDAGQLVEFPYGRNTPATSSDARPLMKVKQTWRGHRL